MNLIFFGDLAAPDEADIKIIKEFLDRTKLFKDKIVIGNLEGLIINEDICGKERYIDALYNNVNVIEFFRDTRKTVLSLANNHIKDIPDKFNSTIKILEQNNIGFSGASSSEKECLNPYEFEINGIKFAVFNHCWNVMSSIIKNKSKSIKIEDKPYDEFIQEVSNYKRKNLNTHVIVYFHWNFDFEKLPFPAHRNIARKLIDNGADIIIASHSHLVNGGEIYKGKPIIYGLGNFYIPSGKFFGGKLIYPNASDISLVLDLNLENNQLILYWIKYDRNKQKIEIQNKEKLENGAKIKEYSCFNKMNEEEYKRYFIKNRVKNKFVPIWYEEKNSISNKIKDIFIIMRMKVFRLIKKILNKIKGV